MRGTEHIAIGVGSTFVVFVALQMSGSGTASTPVVFPLLAAAAGSLGPDLDHPSSLAGLTIPVSLVAYSGLYLISPWLAAQHAWLKPFDLSSLGPLWHAAAWYSLGAGLLLLLLSLVFTAVFGHRGLVHSVGFGAVATIAVTIGLAVSGAPLWLAVPFAWGWLTHLMADSTTRSGLSHAFWPLERSEV